MKKLDDRVLVGLKEGLMEPELVVGFACEYQREFNRRQREKVRYSTGLSFELKAAKTRIERMVGAIEAGMDIGKLRDCFTTLEEKAHWAN